MARKNATPKTPSKTRAKKAVLVAATVASLVGYDPTLLLAAPLPAPEQTLTVSAEDLALLHVELTSPAPTEALMIEALRAPETDAIGTFRAMYAGIEPSMVSDAMFTVKGRFADRAAYEADKNSENDNIHRTLRKVTASLTSDIALRVMMACETDDAFIDRSMRQGAAYNVYAIDKLQDLVGYLAGSPVLNRITGAVLRTMIAFEAAGVGFDMGHAKAAASDKIRVEPRLRPLMHSHTVSASTAPTQASSTMQALVTLGIVESSGAGGAKNASYRFAGTPQAEAIRARIAA